MQIINYTLSNEQGKAILVKATFEMIDGKPVITPLSSTGNPLPQTESEK